MSKLNVDQKTIMLLFSDKKSDFLIPDYQRPYAWEETQCQTLWDDIFLFSFPDNNYEAFDENEEYFLGSVVTYKNEKGQPQYWADFSDWNLSPDVPNSLFALDIPKEANRIEFLSQVSKPVKPAEKKGGKK